MVKKLFLSTLTGKLFRHRKEAQKCEDKYVEIYLDGLEKRAKALKGLDDNKPNGRKCQIDINDEGVEPYMG